MQILNKHGYHGYMMAIMAKNRLKAKESFVPQPLKEFVPKPEETIIIISELQINFA